MKRLSSVAYVIFCIFASATALAQGNPSEEHEKKDSDLYQLDLADLLNVQVAVASKKSIAHRESPGIVTVITENEIRNMGARDLIDVLQLVPGISFGSDVQGVVGFGMRGTWAHEGKTLLIIDDHEMNELNFSTNQFGNHYPVDHIKKIEIIRGPGSAIYGGNAELAVIKITTKDADDLDGVDLLTRYGRMSSAFGRQTLSLQAGKRIGDLKFKVGAFLGGANRSDRNFTDLYGSSFNMAGNSKLNSTFINTNISYKGLDIKFLYDHYVTSYRDGYSIAYPYPIGMNFDSYLGSIKYDIKPIENLVITPTLKIDQFQPWKSNGQDAIDVQGMTDLASNPIYGTTGVAYDRTTNRIRAALSASYDLTDSINLLAGFEKSYFTGRDNLFTYQTTGTPSVNYNSTALYAQSMLSTNIVNLTMGARYEVHNQFGSALVPRLALTKVIDKVHFKLLASSSFRAPGIDNIDTNPKITPERTTVYELEAGYQFTKNLFITANIFDLTINNPIIYTVIPGANNYYANSFRTGSRGMEAELKHVYKGSSTALGYSFYSTAGKNTVDAYSVPDRGNVVLGLPTHKVTLNANHQLSGNLYFNPTIIFMSSRYGYDYAGMPSSVFTDATSASQSAQLVNFKPTWLVNAYFRYKDLFVKNLNLGAGVFNLLNQDYRYIQPYFVSGNAHAPLPSSSREVIFDLAYHIGF